MAAGSIIVDLLMRTGSFETDTKRAAKALKELEKEAKAIGVAIGAAVAVAATALIYLSKQSIDAADSMSKAAQKAGTTTEELSALAYAADLAGVSNEGLTSAMVKLTKNMSDASNGTGDAIDGFKALGISVTDSSGNLKSSSAVLTEVAAKFATMQDSSNKTAIAVKIFGKAGAELIPLLNSGATGLADMAAEAEKLGLVISTETGKAAEEFNDNLTRLGKAVDGVFNRITADLLPSMVELSKEFVNIAKDEEVMSVATEIVRAAIGGLIAVFQTIAVVGSDVGFVFLTVGREAGALAAKIVSLKNLNFDGWRAISSAVEEDSARARAALDKFQARVMALGQPSDGVNSRANSRLARQGGGTERIYNAPNVRSSSAGKSKADTAAKDAAKEAKRTLDGQVKAIQEFANQQRAAFDFANKYVQGAYDAGTISLAEFFDTEKRLRQAGLEATVAALDKELAVERAYAKTVKGDDRIAADNKIAESVAKRAEAIQKSGQDEILAAQASARALEEVGKRYDDLRIQVLELSGQESEASRLRIDRQVADARKTITASGGDQGLATQLQAKLQATDALKQAQDSYNTLLRQTADAEEAIYLAARTSGETELEVLQKVGAVRQDSLTQLDALVAKARELARALGTKDSIAFAEDLSKAFRKASAEVDPVLTRMNELGRDAGSTIAKGLEDAAFSGKGLGDSIKNVLKELGRLVYHEAFTKPLSIQIAAAINTGGSNGGSIMGDILNPGQSSGGGLGGILSGVFGSIFGGGSSFGGGMANPFAKLITGGSMRALGGPVTGGDPYIVGERGPELFVPRSSGTVVPNSALGRPGNTTTKNIAISINPPAGMSTKTQTQFAAETYRQFRMADAHNN